MHVHWVMVLFAGGGQTVWDSVWCTVQHTVWLQSSVLYMAPKFCAVYGSKVQLPYPLLLPRPPWPHWSSFWGLWSLGKHWKSLAVLEPQSDSGTLFSLAPLAPSAFPRPSWLIWCACTVLCTGALYGTAVWCSIQQCLNTSARIQAP